MMRMTHRWNYKNLGQVAYGNAESYRRAAAWFDELGGTLEDWGCGCATAKRYVSNCSYTGIDGSDNAYADRCGIDLRTYTSSPDHILLRDVLDHNEEWRAILANAKASFRKRMVIVIFRQPGPETKVVFVNTDPKYAGILDFQFKLEDLLSEMKPFLIKTETVANETLFYLEKK